MANIERLNTTFAGLKLRNPIIVASCSLTGNAKYNQTLAQAGVGAIVLKSLFEEDIVREMEAMAASAAEHTEAADYMQAYLASHALGNYVELVKESKRLCSETPIIASINCNTEGEWVNFAKAIAQAGADALELNVMSIESSATAEDGELERKHIAIAQSICQAVEIPVIMKLGAAISNHVNLVSRLVACGVKGVVMFNRVYQTDIDIDNLCYSRGSILGTAQDFATPLRYVAITSAAVPKMSLALSGGVQSGECVIKALLAGASAVEVCSTLYRQGNDVDKWVEAALELISKWQEDKGYEQLSDCIGTMNNSCEEHRDEVMRAQFLKHFGAYR
ncbi:MAG: dihydroorotate dehydrogenase-like protein [Rikenellaceae bacterium]